MLTLKNINISLGAREILKDISFVVGDNEKIGIVGVNGAGKSTLLKIIAKVIEPDLGSVSFTGRMSYLSQEIHKEIGVDKEEIHNELVFKLFTDNNEYTFLITINFDDGQAFMEASVKSRKTSAGQTNSIPKVFPNGELSDELWMQLKDCVLKYELLGNVSSGWKEARRRSLYDLTSK